MVRMQVLGLGLVLMLSCAGWASSARVDPRKSHGHWYHIFTASNNLEALRVFKYMRLHSPFLQCVGTNCYAIHLSFIYSWLVECEFFANLMNYRDIFETTFMTRNIIEIVDVTDTMLILGHIDRRERCSEYAILALGRQRTLSDADMKKFQKVLQDKGIVKEPVRFTGDDTCRYTKG